MCIHVRKERIRRAQLQKEEEEFSIKAHPYPSQREGFLLNSVEVFNSRPLFKIINPKQPARHGGLWPAGLRRIFSIKVKNC